MKEIKILKFRFKKGGYGWYLLPLEGDIAILNDLYGTDYDKLSEECMSFKEEDTFEEVKQYLVNYLEEHKYEIKQIEEDYITASKVFLPPPVKVNADLKWSLWSCDESTWQDRCDDDEIDVWNAMKEAFEGNGGEITVYTAPRKEIRYGKVDICEGKAFVHFESVWDSPGCHIPEDCPEEHWDKMREIIAEYFDDLYGYQDGDYEYPLGACKDKVIEASSFEELMVKIDEVENFLLEQENLNSIDFHNYINTVMKAIKNGEFNDDEENEEDE